jgi:DNA-binding response OmpR family regulator
MNRGDNTVPTPRRPVVLIADDDPTIRLILMLNLDAEGMQVEMTGDGAEVVGLARRVHPDVAVLDVMLPGADGCSVLRDLRADPRTADIPVVLLSARTSDDEIWEGWRAGADSYVTKPFDIGELLAIVRAVRRRDDAEAQAEATG